MKLDFFNAITGEELPHKEIGEVHRNANGFWQATIQGGWYVGYGKTKKVAIKSAMKARDDEIAAQEGHR